MARAGDRNTELTLIQNERERAVTLSKRRNGLFKKANELATLCGVEIAILLFSISGKPISFGSPSVHSVVNRYLNSDPNDANSYHGSTNPELIRELNELMERLANAKKKSQMLDEMEKKKKEGTLLKEYSDRLALITMFKEDLDNVGLDELMEVQRKKEEEKRFYEAAIRNLLK